MFKKQIGQKIKEFRKKKTLTQEDLAERINITPHHLSAIERGKYYPSLETTILIMNELDCTADDILSCVLKSEYKVTASFLSKKLEEVPSDEKINILNVLDLLIRNAKNK